MAFSDVLRQARESAASAYHGYLLQKKAEGIHLFFEGRDDESFYVCKIRPRLRPETFLLLLRCGTKKEVYETRLKVEAYPKKAGVNLYFVDQDYDSILGTAPPLSPDIFVTRHYSIENYLVSPEMLKIIWEDLYHLSAEPALYRKTAEQFSASLESFYDLVVTLAAWILAAKEAGQRPNINNIRLAALFQLDDELLVKPRYSRDEELYAELERMCGVPANAVDRGAIQTWLRKLDPIAPKNYVRGKFEMWFFARFLQLLRKALADALLGSKRLSVRTEITETNAVEVLAPRLPLVPDLLKFLETHLTGFSKYC